MTDGRLDAAILRQLMIALAMVGIMLVRPRGLWPTPEHGKAAPQPQQAPKRGFSLFRPRAVASLGEVAR
jgi:UPF0716 family protein affecting phage T7 exclusion